MGLVELGILLIFIGFFIAMLSVILSLKESVKESKVEGGGVLLIGPVPIVFGTNKEIVKIILLVLLVILLALILMWRFI